MGGVSSEKEISLESGRNIFSKLPRKRYEPIPLFMDGNSHIWRIPLKLVMRNSTADIEADLEREATVIPYEKLKNEVDIVYIALHGKYGEDGCFQGLLELLRIPYVGSGVLASAVGMKKDISRKILALTGIDVPKTVLIDASSWERDSSDCMKRIEDEIGYPCVIKPSREGCSTAVSKVVSPEGISLAFKDALSWDNEVLVEEFLQGMEVTCGVIGNEKPMALTPSETIPTAEVLSLEDKFLYGQGENKTPARLPGETLAALQDTAIRTFKALGLKVYARIDMFVAHGGRIVVLEPNSLPGMTPSTVLFHQAAASGINQSELMDRIIRYSFEAHRTKKGPL
jgi:D-alanine-D-alanine ligase